MSHQIKFECSDKLIVSEHNESVLDSAVRAGLPVNYGCSNGNCGLCVARLISGEIKQIHHNDHHLPPDERQDGQFLMCTHTAADDLTLETNLSDTATHIKPQTFPAKVRAVQEVSNQIRILTLQPSRSHRLRFFAGQYGRIKKKDTAIEYAIASCPCDERRLEFHIADVPGNDFCYYIFNQCSNGEVLHIEAPFGNFVYSEDSERPLIFFACGIGFAPIKSLLEHITAQDTEMPIYLYWAAPEGEHYLDNLCCSWGDAFDNLDYRRLTLDINDNAMITDCIMQLLNEHANLPYADIYLSTPAKVLPDVYRAMHNRPEGWRMFFEKIHAAT